MFLGSLLVATGLVTTPDLYWSALMMSLGMAVPASAIFVQKRENQRWFMALVTIVLLCMGPLALIFVSHVSITNKSPLFVPLLTGIKNFWLGIGISTWISVGMSTRD